MQPEQFWQLHPTELWWLIDAKRPRQTFGKYGMTEDDMQELVELLPDMRAW